MALKRRFHHKSSKSSRHFPLKIFQLTEVNCEELELIVYSSAPYFVSMQHWFTRPSTARRSRILRIGIDKRDTARAWSCCNNNIKKIIIIYTEIVATKDSYMKQDCLSDCAQIKRFGLQPILLCLEIMKK